MEKHRFVGKTKEEAIENAKIGLQELEENLIIKETEVQKGGLFKSKKVEIEVIEKREVVKEIKNYGTIVTSNSGWKSTNFYMKEIRKPYNLSGYTFQGFIYC